MSSGYPPCQYTMYIVVSKGGQGAISPPKSMFGTRGLDDPQHKVVLLIFKVIESLKIGDGPLTVVMGQKWPHHIGPSGNTAYMSRQQINKMTCAPSGDSDQPWYLPSDHFSLSTIQFFIFQSHRNLSYLTIH